MTNCLAGSIASSLLSRIAFVQRQREGFVKLPCVGASRSSSKFVVLTRQRGLRQAGLGSTAKCHAALDPIAYTFRGDRSYGKEAITIGG